MATQSKLAVILHADVVGSTGLVRKDELLGHDRIRAAFEGFADTVRAYKGTVSEVRGDALVAEFARASDAVLAALAAQATNGQRNATLTDNIVPEMRVGIALGEVVIADETVTGGGVVLAQRLEQLAESGGVCVQGSVYEAVSQRLPLDYASLGEQSLKGFDEPVRAYAVALRSGEALPLPEQVASTEVKVERPRRRWVGGAVVALLLLLGGTVAWIWPWKAPPENTASSSGLNVPARTTREFEKPTPEQESGRRLALLDKPSIAVLAFNNMSDDPKQDYFAEGIAEDIITDLSKVSGLFVVARNSSFSYKGENVAVKTIAETLGVRYVVEGSVRRAGDTLRITAQLIDASTDGHLWAERYDGSAKDVFGLQDEVTEQIVRALASELTPEEASGIRREQTTSVEAHDAYLQGLALYHRRTADDNAAAELHFRRAIELDANFVGARTALAKVYMLGTETGGGNDAYRKALGLAILGREAPGRIRKLLERATSKPDANYHVVRSWLSLRTRQHTRAFLEAKRALALSPNDAEALEAAARALIFAGRSAEGVEFAKEAMKQNPLAPAEPLYLMGLAEYVSDNSARAVELLERASRLAPSASYGTMLAIAYADTGRSSEAQELYRASRADANSSSVFSMVLLFPFSQRLVVERFAANLSTSGALNFGYFPLYEENKLSGREIQALLYGSSIKGTHGDEFFGPWSQRRTLDGHVTNTGVSTAVLVGRMFETPNGVGQIKDDTLCEVWPDFSDTIEFCATFFRIPDATARIKEKGDYVMVTDLGPQPFRVVKRN